MDKTRFCSLCIALVLLFSTSAYGALLNIGTDEARPLSFNQPVTTVFVSNPDIADYQVISENKIVVFGKKSVPHR